MTSGRFETELGSSTKLRLAKAALAVGGATLVLGCVSGASATSDAGREPAASSPVKVVFVDVAQGDGVIVKVGGRIIVSDAGLPSAADEMHTALEALGANRHIDVAILSHAHADHVGGFIGLLDTYGYTIDKAVLARHPHYDATLTNRALIAALEGRGVPIVRVKRGDQFFWGGASWRILNPPAGQFQGPLAGRHNPEVGVMDVMPTSA